MPWPLVVCGLLSVGLHLLLFGLAGAGSDTLRPPPFRGAAEAVHAVRVRVVANQLAPAPEPRVEPAKKAAQAPLPASGPPQPPSEFDAYLPRHLLSEPPAALTDIVIEPPTKEEFPGRRVGILTLFIDEDGQVRHVAPDDILLPPVLEQAAREAFMAGRFAPGLVAGSPAKSRMRVEVVFE